jgi:gliding motility-associated-like protein
MKKIYFAFSFLVFSISQIIAQVTTTVNPTIAQLQQKLSGNGITITGLTLTCPTDAYALYSGGTGNLAALPSGILLTTGTATNVAGPNTNDNDVDNNGPGSTLGNTLAGSVLPFGGTHDACYLQFILTPSCNTLSINYVFASEEYPEYSAGGINDVFGFVIDGPNPSGGNYTQKNIATVPGSTTAVSIQNVNNGTTNSGPCVNCAFYEDNPIGMVYDGCTTVLTASTAVTPCSQYTMTIGVWDDSDWIIDSGVFLDVNGLSCVGSPTLTTAATPTSICAPQTITLTAGGGIAGGTYTWSAPASGGLVTTVGQTVTANPTSTTTYTLSYSDINTCPGSPLTTLFTFSVSPLPGFTAVQSPAGSICAGQSVTLTANGGAGTYTWVPATGLSTTSNSVTVASPTTTTTYTVTRSVGSCSSFTTITVNITSGSAIAISPSTSTICAGQSMTLSATGSAPFVWTASSGANPPATQTVVVTPTTTTSYTVVAGPGTCTASAVASVSVIPAFTVSVTPSSTVLCNGATAALTASGATNYTWTPFSGLNAYTGANVTANPSTTTNYTITGQVGTCTNTTVATVSVIVVSPTITASSPNYCSGSTPVTLTGSGATTYSWAPGSSLTSTSGTTVGATPSTTTIYTVTGTTGACSSTKTISINGYATPTIVITPPSTLICNGSSSALTASGATNYSWTPLYGLTAYTGPNVTANPTITTTYSIVGINGVCTGSTTATVSVTTVSTSVTASSANYCVGSPPVTFTATGASTYSWAPPAGLSSTTGSVVTATPTITTTYSVTGTIGTCSTTKTITVTVTPTPTITVTSPSTLICSGGAGTTLTASGATTYTWAPTTSSGTTLSANPSSTTTYTAFGQTAGGCVAVPGVITVSVSSTPIPTLTASSPTVCLSSTVSISANPATGYTYNWQPASEILGASNTSSIIAKPTTSANVIYTLTLSNGVCVASNTISLQVSLCTPPTASFSTLTNDSICTKGCISFTNTTTGATPISYQWVFPGGTPPTSTSVNPQVCYFAPGNYTVVLIATNINGSDTLIKNNYINVADTPDVRAFIDTLIRIGQSVTISATGASNYQWLPNNGTLDCNTCASTIASPTVTTQYIVTGSNSPYCRSRDTIVVTVDATCGDFFVPTAFSPNNDGLNETINVHGYCISIFNLQIYNRWGEKVFETSSKENSWDGTFKGKPCDTGVFVYRADGISIDGKAFNLKGNITLIR